MTPIDGSAILTAAEMSAAEDRVVAAGSSVGALMDRAGIGIATVVHRLAAGADVLILCGSGNNGGDGWVAAATLAAAGHPVRVAQLAEPATDPARSARARWTGAVTMLAAAQAAPVTVDALFGTGLSRPLDAATQAHLGRYIDHTRLSIAVDVPSGVATDSGALLGEVPRFDLTLALGAAKPAHLLEPAASRCGTMRLLDIGVPGNESLARVLAKPQLAAPGPASHKYSRGMVAIVAGAMAGAALLAAEAAMRAGAGYVSLLGGEVGGPHALVHQPLSDDTLGNPRIGALLIGPGLGRDDAARDALDRALATDHPLVIDGDALHLVDLARLATRQAPAILTPHAGEFAALFGDLSGSKLDQAREGARRAGAVVVFKGPDTVIAAPDGRARLTLTGNNWLSTAGTGDVLAGAVAAMLAARLDPLEAAAAAVWLHADAARRAGAAFLADDLVRQLTPARAFL